MPISIAVDRPGAMLGGLKGTYGGCGVWRYGSLGGAGGWFGCGDH